jgi:hypothetical protein
VYIFGRRYWLRPEQDLRRKLRSLILIFHLTGTTFSHQKWRVLPCAVQSPFLPTSGLDAWGADEFDGLTWGGRCTKQINQHQLGKKNVNGHTLVPELDGKWTIVGRKLQLIFPKKFPMNDVTTVQHWPVKTGRKVSSRQVMV